MTRRLTILGLAAALLTAAPLGAQHAQLQPASPSLAPFDWLNGAWRGTATIETPQGTVTLTQSERFGPMLGGAVRLIEGRGYGPKGDVKFNAFAVLFGRPDGTYAMHAWAQGREGIYQVKLQSEGFDWEIPAGPITIRYEARRIGGKWIETGYRIVPGKPPVQFYRKELTRIGNANWNAGAVKAK